MDSVLVVIGFTSYKNYCRHLHPKIFDSLTYKNKELAFIDEKSYPRLLRYPTGEEICAAQRQIGIEIAREKGYDWIFQLDIDAEPPVDIIERMLEVDYPLVGGLLAARGNSWQLIGHNYKDRQKLERVWLKPEEVDRNQVVDGISGGTLLIRSNIFCRVDLTGYVGPSTIPLRFTADDEFYQIKVYNSFKLKPKVCSSARSWHYSDDGRAYRVWGEVKQWREY